MDLTPALSGLTDKQRLYVQARLEGDNPGQAARRAGVKDPSRSWKLMEVVPAVQEALQRGREISIATTGITREKITEMFLEAYRNATNTMEQVAATKELAKLHGLYEASKLRIEHKHEEVRSEDDLRRLTVAELRQLTAIDGEFIDVTPAPERALVHRE